uniref:Ribonuclease H-like domain-containing protein n=1 Tax=Tanacetum cinerariifolium TaxID=118510 RepID=A0A699GK36_TANCI|nr:ribonuclease H-like domain-containing protein [Tanacetum cinerariifolium]
MQDELLQFRLQKVWRLVDLPKGKHAIRTKWVYRNKKDKRGIVVRNKTRLVVQGYTQEKGINYDEVFAHVARIEALRLFLAYTSFMGFIVYQMDVKSAFLYGTIDEEVMEKDDGIFICQDKYVADILKKFDFSSVKTASTPIEANKALLKDEEAEDTDVHLYRSMIRIFRYLKGQTKLGLWYPMDSPFYLEAFIDSDYAGASLDKKSTTRVYTSCIEQLWASAKVKNDVPKNMIYYLIKSAIFTAVASLFFWQWQLSSLAVGTSSASGNSITGSRNALEDAINHLADLDNLQSCISSKSDHLLFASSSLLEACSRSSQFPDPSSESSPSP